MPSNLYLEPQPVYIRNVEGDIYIGGPGRARISPGGPDRGGACSRDVRQCPDGSYVSRRGPRCEFPPCPSLDAFADAVNRRNRKTHQDYIDEISKTYLTGAWLGMIAVHDALQNGRFDESLRKQMAQLANAKPIAKATVPLPATTEVTMRFVPTVEGADTASLPVRFWDMYNSRLASIRTSYGSLQSGFVGMDASSLTLRDVSAENYAKVYKVAQDASMNPTFGAEVIFAPFVPAPQPVSGPTPEQIGDEAKAGLGAIAPGTPIIGPDGNVIYYGDQERPGGGPVPPSPWRPIMPSPPIVGPIFPVPRPPAPDPRNPPPSGGGLCYDGMSLGPESLLYLTGQISLCEPEEPPLEPGPGDGGGDGNGGGDGDGGGDGGGGSGGGGGGSGGGGGGSGGGGGGGGSTGGGTSGRDDDCGCYCEDDMEVASQPGPAGLTRYCRGKLVYENKKCGGFYVAGGLQDGQRTYRPLPRGC